MSGLSSKLFEQKKNQIEQELNQQWDSEILPLLEDYIRIPNKSPAYDKDWLENGYMDQAVNMFADWAKKQAIKDMKVEVIKADGRTPLIFIEIPGQIDDTIFLYGHLDKQPEMKGWDEDKGPWIPVYQDNKLYGRGGADDGYSLFSSLSSIAALQRHGIPHSRCIVFIEACEESGSYDLPYYLESLKERIGTPSLLVALDSSCGNYEQLWSTTSLRGLVLGDLSIKVLESGMHSGMGGGLAPSPNDILRELLDRLTDSHTGNVIPDALKTTIPEQRLAQAMQTGETLGKSFLDMVSLVGDAKPLTVDIGELVLNNTWRTNVAVVGISGLPETENAGNVLIPEVSVRISTRVPPNGDPVAINAAIKEILEANPPYGAEVHYECGVESSGWEAPALAPWLEEASELASQRFYGKPSVYLGIGASIPFMAMLGDMFPEAQFLITGVLGPKSNAHGPNEFLHIPMVKSLTCCMASIIASHFDTFA